MFLDNFSEPDSMLRLHEFVSSLILFLKQTFKIRTVVLMYRGAEISAAPTVGHLREAKRNRWDYHNPWSAESESECSSK